jgi:uridylate kinase
MKYKRVLVKLSGEALSGPAGFGINTKSLETVAAELKKVYSKKIQIALVVGGGNIWRGAGKEIERVTADYMGMLATVINALALRDILVKNGMPARVQSAIEISKIAEPYVRDESIRHLEAGRIVILAAGTGNPFFTTDTTAALRAAELKCDVLLKATQVDGVYSDDPKKNKKAKKFKSLTFDEAIERGLKVMDTAAFTLCRESALSIIVFNFHKPGNLLNAVSGKPIGTTVYL